MYHEGLSSESFLVNGVPDNKQEYPISKWGLLIEPGWEYSLVSKKWARVCLVDLEIREGLLSDSSSVKAVNMILIIEGWSLESFLLKSIGEQGGVRSK